MVVHVMLDIVITDFSALLLICRRVQILQSYRGSDLLIEAKIKLNY